MPARPRSRRRSRNPTEGNSNMVSRKSNDVVNSRSMRVRRRTVDWRSLGMLAAMTVLFFSTPAIAADEPDIFTRTLAKGPAYATFGAFIGGLLVCLTPCVYPMIAITVSVFGARQSKSRLDAMMLSTSFVLGIAAMFTPLGVVAGYTGSLFGAALANPFVLALVAV